MPFNATPGDASANSYATVEQADAFFDTVLYRSLWPATGAAGADLLKKQTALMEACRRIENFFFRGQAASAGQRLKWPRSGVWNADRTDFLPDDDTPEVIREAQCELAYHLLKNDPTNEISEELKQFKRLKLPGIEIETKDTPVSEGSMPSEVMRKLAPFMTAGGGTARIVRG